ncbi:MAG: protein phosphatase [Synechococcus sp.]|nr:protein phosphatase [Synechococcus sp.]
MFKRLLPGLLAGATLSTLAVAAEAGTNRPVRWKTGGAVWTTNAKAFGAYFASGEIDDRALNQGIAESGWTADEIREGMIKTYDVDLVGVSRFLYSTDGEKWLDEQTRSYFPYWMRKKTSVVALRSAIIADAVDGQLSSAGIMKNLPVDFALADNGKSDGAQNVCKAGLDAPRDTSLLSWYVFLPACVQANQVLPAEPAPAAAPVRGLW